MSKSSRSLERKSRSKKKSGAPSKSYEPNAQERAALEAYYADKSEKLPPPALKVEHSGETATVMVDHEDQAVGITLLMSALGTTSNAFTAGMLTQLAAASAKDGETEPRSLNFMLSVINSVEPKDELEAMLASQMAAVHMATMTMARRLAQVETIPQQDSAERAFNKLARTFTAQVEALKRYRTGGQQKVTVEHVNVSDGGQAIVGNVSHGGRGASKKAPTTP